MESGGVGGGVSGQREESAGLHLSAAPSLGLLGFALGAGATTYQTRTAFEGGF